MKYMCHTVWGTFDTPDGLCAHQTWMPFDVLDDAEIYYNDPDRLNYARRVTLYVIDGGEVINGRLNG